jgi:hypothetical protein
VTCAITTLGTLYSCKSLTFSASFSLYLPIVRASKKDYETRLAGMSKGPIHWSHPACLYSPLNRVPPKGRQQSQRREAVWTTRF